MKILLVEDAADLRNVLVKRLSKEYSVDSCKDGEEALDFLAVYDYDLVILDIMLPKVNGLEVLKSMRSDGKDTPILLLSALDAIEDRVKGLDAGADDYLVKPFAFEELLARLRVMTRHRTGKPSNELRVGDLTNNRKTKEVKRAGKTIDLSSKEYMLLDYLMSHANITLTRSQLEQSAWNSSFEGGSNIIDVYIRYLRKKIDEEFDTKMIRTVRGSGYRLEGPTDEKNFDQE